VIVEHLWSRADATGGRPATHSNGPRPHGKEGVDGSSPSEGLQEPRIEPDTAGAALDGAGASVTSTLRNQENLLGNCLMMPLLSMSAMPTLR
jgi:hypothetical protein